MFKVNNKHTKTMQFTKQNKTYYNNLIWLYFPGITVAMIFRLATLFLIFSGDFLFLQFDKSYKYIAKNKITSFLQKYKTVVI